MVFLRLFKNNRAGGVAVVVILGLGLFIQTLMVRGEAPIAAGMSLYNLIFSPLQKIPFINTIVSFSILLLSGYTLNRIGIRFSMLEDRSFMPAIFYLLFAASLPESRHLSPALAGSLFYLLCFGIIFDSSDKEPDTFSIFKAGLLLAAGSLFYLKLIWFLPLIWISIGAIRPANWREMVYPFIALLIGGLLLFTWYWGIRDDGGKLVEIVKSNLAFNSGFVSRHFSGYILYGYFMLLIFIASLYMINRFQSRKTFIQNIYQVLFYMFLSGLLFYVFIEGFNPHALVYVAIPVSFVLSNYFHRRANHWTDELFLWILAGLVIYVQVTG